MATKEEENKITDLICTWIKDISQTLVRSFERKIVVNQPEPLVTTLPNHFDSSPNSGRYQTATTRILYCCPSGDINPAQ